MEHNKLAVSTKSMNISIARKTTIMLDHIFSGYAKPKKGQRKPVPVKINNVVYGSIAIAARALNLNWVTVSNRIRSKDFEWVNWKELNKPIKLDN